MRILPLLLCLAASLSYAQTAETATFRAVMLPAGEVPAINGSTARGVADVTASVLRDGSGQIVSGTVDILTRITFPAAVTATGLALYSGAAGQNGAIALATPLSTASSYAVQANGDSLHYAVQIDSSNASALLALRNLYQNPAQFYLNLITTANPNGAMRGQLQKAQVAMMLGLMSSANVLPGPAFPQAYGVAQVIAIGTRDAAGNWTSGELYLSLSYNSQDFSTLTSFQIHTANAAVVFSATLPGGLTAPPDGIGTLGPYYIELSTTTATQTSAFTALFSNPSSLYVDVHSSASPAGVLRAQLRSSDSAAFPLFLSSSNETAAAPDTGSMPATLTLYTVRNSDGSIAAGTFLVDLDFRFAVPQQFLGVQIHRGITGQDGAAAIALLSNLSSDAGSGNLHAWSLPLIEPGVLRDLVREPSEFYLNVHTAAAPAGAVRAQLADTPEAPRVAALIAATLDASAVSVAPGELVSLFGAGLAQVPAGLSGWQGDTGPFELNGVTVTIANRAAPLLYVSPSQINAQIPADVPLGPQLVVISNRGAGASFTVNVVAAAPSIFSAAASGSTAVVLATGVGEGPLTVTIGGKSAPVTAMVASGGVYRISAAIPAGLSGPQPVVLQQGGISSAPVPIALK